MIPIGTSYFLLIACYQYPVNNYIMSSSNEDKINIPPASLIDSPIPIPKLGYVFAYMGNKIVPNEPN